MNDKFYQYSLPQPFHISVGAVVFNEQYEICLHHFEKKNIPEQLQFLGDYLDDVWHLVRESLDGDESLQTAVQRGVQEELGMVGKVEKYLGAKIDMVTRPDGDSFEKLTPYHAVRAVEYGERPSLDAENKTILEWHSPSSALAIYRKQAKKTARPELNEAIIIERFIAAYGL